MKKDTFLFTRERDNGKIIRACDDEPGTMYEYHKCYESGKSIVIYCMSNEF